MCNPCFFFTYKDQNYDFDEEKFVELVGGVIKTFVECVEFLILLIFKYPLKYFQD